MNLFFITPVWPLLVILGKTFFIRLAMDLTDILKSQPLFERFLSVPVTTWIKSKKKRTSLITVQGNVLPKRKLSLTSYSEKENKSSHLKKSQTGANESQTRSLTGNPVFLIGNCIGKGRDPYRRPLKRSRLAPLTDLSVFQLVLRLLRLRGQAHTTLGLKGQKFYYAYQVFSRFEAQDSHIHRKTTKLTGLGCVFLTSNTCTVCKSVSKTC